MIEYLDEELKKVAPIDGVSMRDPGNKSTWTIHFKEEATAKQRAAAQAAISSYDSGAAARRENAKKALASSDANLPRRLEDLYALVIQKGIFTEAEVEAASPGLVQKMAERKTNRGKLEGKP